MAEPQPQRVQVTTEEFGELFRSVSTWGRWDERGTLNRLVPERVAAAAALVQEGISVSLGLPLNTTAAADNPEPAVPYMTSEAKGDDGPGDLRFPMDFGVAANHPRGTP